MLREDRNQYWIGGMRKGALFVKEKIEADCCLLANDDIDFCEYSIEKMVGTGFAARVYALYEDNVRRTKRL